MRRRCFGPAPGLLSPPQRDGRLDGRFDLISVHVFLVLRRLGQQGRPAKRLGQELFDMMFADMDQSLRELGASDMSIGRPVKLMAKAFYGRIDAYDRGLGQLSALEDALARNLYRGAPVDAACLRAMAVYMQREATALAGQTFADLKPKAGFCSGRRSCHDGCGVFTPGRGRPARFAPRVYEIEANGEERGRWRAASAYWASIACGRGLSWWQLTVAGASTSTGALSPMCDRVAW